MTSRILRLFGRSVSTRKASNGVRSLLGEMLSEQGGDDWVAGGSKLPFLDLGKSHGDILGEGAVNRCWLRG